MFICVVNVTYSDFDEYKYYQIILFENELNSKRMIYVK